MNRRNAFTNHVRGSNVAVYMVLLSLLLSLGLTIGDNRQPRRVLLIFLLDGSARLSQQETAEMLRCLAAIVPLVSPQQHICEFITFGSCAGKLPLPQGIVAHPVRDLAAAVELTLLLKRKYELPTRLALFGDGCIPDIGQVLSPLTRQHIPVFVWYPASRTPEARLLAIKAPAYIADGVKIPLQISLTSDGDVALRLRLYANEKLCHEQQLLVGKGAQQMVEIEMAPQPVGMICWRGEIEGDSRTDNNRGFAVTQVIVPRTVLVVSDQESPLLEQALSLQHLSCKRVAWHAVPELASYPVVVLESVAAHRLAGGIWQDYLRQGGSLLVMPDEILQQPWLPVAPKPPSPEPPRREEPPPAKSPAKKEQVDVELEMRSVAMLFVIDQSGSMEGEKLALAQQAALRSISFLWTQDWIGVLSFSDQPRWILPLLRGADPEWVKRQVMNIQASGGTSIAPALSKSLQALRESPAHIKHVILLSDGQDQDLLARRNLEPLVAEMRNANITLTTIGIGGDYDPVLMPVLARWGGGEFYYASDFQEIPVMVLRDVDRVLRFRKQEKKSSLDRRASGITLPAPTKTVEAPQPRDDESTQRQRLFSVHCQGDLLKPLLPFPGLASYLPYQARPGAQTELGVGDDVLLCHWQWQRGRVMVWGGMSAWQGWARYPQFAARMVRFLGGERLAPTPFTLRGEALGDEHWAAILECSGDRNVNSVIASEYKFYRQNTYTWQAIVPTALPGEWKPLSVGVGYDGDRRVELCTAFALGYMAEVADLHVADATLRDLADNSGGGCLPATAARLLSCDTQGAAMEWLTQMPEILLAFALFAASAWLLALSFEPQNDKKRQADIDQQRQ